MKGQFIFSATLMMCFCLVALVNAQQKDSVTTGRDFKNTIRFNISAPLIFGGRYLVVGYERVTGNNSFSINVGAFGLPEFIGNSDSLKAFNSRNNKGFHISGDYRFYLAKENRYHAPHGVYIGPYYSFNHLSRENTWQFNTTSFNGQANTTLNVNIHTAGVELGYQFIFWRRMALDFVAVGPGIGHYNFKTGLANTLEPAQRNELLTNIANIIREKIPGAGNFLNNAHYSRDSGISAWAIGYRYIVHIGYRF